MAEDPRGRSERTTYVVDGVEYASLEEMPPEVRRVYQETVHALRSAGGEGSHTEVRRFPGGAVIRSSGTKISVDGKAVDPADLPPGVREVYERYMEGREGVAEAGSGSAGERGRVKELGEPERGGSSHTVRVVAETRYGGSSRASRRTGYPPWVNVLILAVCAAILAAIFLAS